MIHATHMNSHSTHMRSILTTRSNSPSHHTCVAWLVHVCDVSAELACGFVTWLIHMCSMTHFICGFVTWLIHMCNMTHFILVGTAPWPHVATAPRTAAVWHDSYICVTWLMRDMSAKFGQYLNHPQWQHLARQLCDITHSNVWHDSCATFQLSSCSTLTTHSDNPSQRNCMTLLIQMCDMTHARLFSWVRAVP